MYCYDIATIYRIAGNFRKHASKYEFEKIFLKSSQPTSFRKNIFENPANNVR